MIASRYEALCSKHNVSDGDKELFIEIMMFRKMDAYEYLCDKYKMSDDDRDALAGSVLLANQLTCLYDQTNDERKYV